jgi:hypothetical protein
MKSKKRKVRLLDKDVASYLDMTEFTTEHLVDFNEMISPGKGAKKTISLTSTTLSKSA